MFTMWFYQFLALLGYQPYRNVVIAKLMHNGFNKRDAMRIYHHAFAPLSHNAYMRLYIDVINNNINAHSWQGVDMLLHAMDAEVLAALQAYMDSDYLPMLVA